MKKYHLITFGCQANRADSERISSVLEKAGVKPSPARSKADIIIFNTCSVRQKAEDRVFGFRKEAEKIRAKSKNVKFVLTGCMMHYEPKELKARLPFIDVFIDIKEITKLPKLLGLPKIPLKKKEREDYLSIAPKYSSSFSAGIPISYGCNNFCTYCIVPYSRKREYSRPVEDIYNEAKKLIEAGCKEIWLLGQNVNSYKGEIRLKKPEPPSETLGLPARPTTVGRLGGAVGSSNNIKIEARVEEGGSGRHFKHYICNFPCLLRLINSIPGDFWIRFTSPHPKDFSDELIKAMTECEKFAHYINLPLQSGDNTILKKMNRPYTVGHYKKLVKKIRRAIPDIAISTDIIVGFPGETKRQFENTAKVMEEIGFDMAYISEYSPRPGTAAAKTMEDNVPHREKECRKKILNSILMKSALKNNKKLVGKIERVLVDGKKDGRWFGRNAGNKVVEIEAKGKKIRLGEFIDVKITKAEVWKLKGKTIK